MGTNESKLAQKVPEKTGSEEQGSIPSTPILTPKFSRENSVKEDLDPRSPSKHIARTPIELLSAAAEKLHNLTLENTEIEVPKETPLKQHIFLGIDPRSPTLEIQRTPIVVSASPDKKFPQKIRNKNLDKVMKCELPNTPKDKIVPPKLLESCTVTPKPKSDAYKRKSFVLLETNIDFTETDLDDVIKEKGLGNSLQNISALEEASYCEIDDPRSPTVDFLRTPIQICKKEQDIENIETEEPVVQNENKVVDINKINETSVNIENMSTVTSQLGTLILAVNQEDDNDENLTAVEVINHDCTESRPNNADIFEEESEEEQQMLSSDNGIVENEEPTITISHEKFLPPTPDQKMIIPLIPKQDPIFPKSAPVSPPSIVSVTPKRIKSQPATPPLIDLTADVKELDKKLTNLIYEDEDLVVCPRIVKIKDQNRTPLGVRNGTDNRKCTQKLKVSDKPRKAEYAVSKIPVFKEKKIKVQCENTPPRGMRDNMHKKSQWDAKDDTLVI